MLFTQTVLKRKKEALASIYTQWDAHFAEKKLERKVALREVSVTLNITKTLPHKSSLYRKLVRQDTPSEFVGKLHSRTNTTHTHDSCHLPCESNIAGEKFGKVESRFIFCACNTADLHCRWKPTARHQQNHQSHQRWSLQPSLPKHQSLLGSLTREKRGARSIQSEVYIHM